MWIDRASMYRHIYGKSKSKTNKHTRQATSCGVSFPCFVLFVRICSFVSGLPPVAAHTILASRPSPTFDQSCHTVTLRCVLVPRLQSHELWARRSTAASNHVSWWAHRCAEAFVRCFSFPNDKISFRAFFLRGPAGACGTAGAPSGATGAAGAAGAAGTAAYQRGRGIG